jgi:hypothetical protein
MGNYEYGHPVVLLIGLVASGALVVPLVAHCVNRPAKQDGIPLSARFVLALVMHDQARSWTRQEITDVAPFRDPNVVGASIYRLVGMQWITETFEADKGFLYSITDKGYALGLDLVLSTRSQAFHDALQRRRIFLPESN